MQERSFIPIRKKSQNPGEPHYCGQSDTDASQRSLGIVVCRLSGALGKETICISEPDLLFFV